MMLAPNTFTEALLKGLLGKEGVLESLQSIINSNKLSRPTLNKLSDIILPLLSEDAQDTFTSTIDGAKLTDIERLLQSFIHSLDPDYADIHKLVRSAEKLLNNSADQTKFTELSSPEELSVTLAEVSKFINLLKGQIMAARSGDEDGFQILGLNTLSNTSDKKLLELTTEEARELLKDLAIYKNHIDFIASMLRAVSGKALKEDDAIGFKLK